MSSTNVWIASLSRIGHRPFAVGRSAAASAGPPERVSITRDVVVDTGLRVSELCQANVGDLQRVRTYTALQGMVKGAITLKTIVTGWQGVASDCLGPWPRAYRQALPRPRAQLARLVTAPPSLRGIYDTWAARETAGRAQVDP